MRKGMRHSSSMKNKNSVAINILEDKLFSKLQTLQNNTGPISRLDDLDFKLLNSKSDALTDLIYRAKGITFENQDKITKAKRQLRVSKKQSAGTFLTGTGIYAVQDQPKQQPVLQQVQLQYDPDQQLKKFIKNDQEDDLAQLRRMIKATDQNLGGYSRQVYQIKKDVLNAANTFKSQLDFDLSNKLHKLQTPSKKTSSMTRIREPRYN